VEAVAKRPRKCSAAPPATLWHQAHEDGVIADFKVTEKMLNYFIQKAHNRKMLSIRASSSACPLRLRRSKARRRGFRLSRQGQRSLPRRTGHGSRHRRGLPITEPSATWWSTSAVAPQTSPSFALRHRLLPLVRMAATRWTKPLPTTSSASTTCSSASAPPSTSRWRSARLPARQAHPHRDQGRNLIERRSKTITSTTARSAKPSASVSPSL